MPLVRGRRVQETLNVWPLPSQASWAGAGRQKGERIGLGCGRSRGESGTGWVQAQMQEYTVSVETWG